MAVISRASQDGIDGENFAANIQLRSDAHSGLLVIRLSNWLIFLVAGKL